jgi:hypothetical protein
MSAPESPGFWRDERGPLLRPAIEAYLGGKPMTTMQLAAMRAYLRQWIAAPIWEGPMIEKLRADIETLYSREAITAWIERAEQEGIDPL